jgi:solute carrier family 25 (mitochondrial carnitine/acylcarnitine transporter), member 20/29
MEHTTTGQFCKNHAITIAATNSALCSILVGYPFDSVKTRMQAYRYKSTWKCISSTFYLEGVRGFYRGIIPLVSTSTVLRAVSWNIYSTNKVYYQEFFNQRDIHHVGIPCFISGMTTGWIMSMFGAPIEFIKVQRQLQKMEHNSNRNLVQWVRHIIKSKGFFGLYSGYRFHAPVDILGTGFYFGVYETFKSIGPKENGLPAGWVSLMGGGLAGAISWILVFPLDVVKSLVQKEALTTTRSFSAIVTERYREFGIKGFYRGLPMQLVRSVPVHALNFYVYENVLHFCRSI